MCLGCVSADASAERVESCKRLDGMLLIGVNTEQLKGCGLPENDFHNCVATIVD